MANQEHLDKLKQGVEAWNRWRRENGEIKRPDLNGADLSGNNLSRADLYCADLIDARLRSANLYGATLGNANLSGADLHRAELSGADLSYTNLDGADLRIVTLLRANLSGATLCSANLLRANLGSATLYGADLRSACLQNADLRTANLCDANLQDANLIATFIGGTIFANNDISSTRGLETIQHSGRSSIGIDTIYKSGGQIPESFLRGCGVPDSFILFAKSLIGKAIDYYSAFISYSSKNHDIAERLHADLQSKGVRCWFAPEDLKIGDPFRQRIDEAIRLHDKLLLILSAESVTSNWVASEVEAALEREDREKRLVLFPLRIDDAVEQSNTAGAALLRRTRHIGDFSRWKDHDSYSKAFGRLLRDLKAETS